MIIDSDGVADRAAGLALLHEEFSRSDAHFAGRFPDLDTYLADMLDPRYRVAIYRNEAGVAGALLYSVRGRRGMCHFFAVPAAARGSGGVVFRMLVRHCANRYGHPFVVKVHRRDAVMRDYHLRLGGVLDAYDYFHYEPEPQ